MVLAVSSVVHSEEADCNEDWWHQGLSNEGESDQGYELPEVVGTCDFGVPVEVRDASCVIMVASAEALEMKVAEKVHNFGKAK